MSCDLSIQCVGPALCTVIFWKEPGPLGLAFPICEVGAADLILQLPEFLRQLDVRCFEKYSIHFPFLTIFYLSP